MPPQRMLLLYAKRALMSFEMLVLESERSGGMHRFLFGSDARRMHRFQSGSDSDPMRFRGFGSWTLGLQAELCYWAFTPVRAGEKE